MTLQPFEGDLRKGLHVENSGVVHDGVDLAEFLERCHNHTLGALGSSDRTVVGYRAPTSLLDLGDHFIGRLARCCTIAGQRGTEVVDDDGGPACRKGQRILAAKSSSSAG